MDGAGIENKPVEVAEPCVPESEMKVDEVATETIEQEKVAVSETVAAEENAVKETEAQKETAEAGETGEKKLDGEDTVMDDAPSIYRPPAGMLRVSGRRSQKEFVKSDAATLAESDDPREIRKQVEFYFGDSNLPEDKFLWEKVGGAENKPVPVKLITNFSRMRRFKPYEAVVKALKTCNFFVIDGPEGEETIRRKNPIDTEKRDKKEERSVYVKGFGDETSSTQFDIEAFFAQYGQFDSVRLRRAEPPKKVFKGSVFVEWSDKETADKFMALDPKPQWKGHPLHIMTKLNYIKQKSEAIREGKIEANGTHRGGRGSHRGNRGNSRGGRDAGKDDWKKRREQDQKNGNNDRDSNNRGRGRGGRGRGRGNFRGRGGRDNGSTREQNAPVNSTDDGRPKIHVSKEGAKVLEEAKNKAAETNGKRARDDDSTAEPPAKKVDTKEAATASS